MKRPAAGCLAPSSPAKKPAAKVSETEGHQEGVKPSTRDDKGRDFHEVEQDLHESWVELRDHNSSFKDWDDAKEEHHDSKIVIMLSLSMVIS